MIKKLYCFFIGHDLDVNDRRPQILHEDGKETKRYLKMWCKRCQQYKRVS